MCPEPDRTWKFGPLLIRRWGKFVRVNLGRWTFGLNVPGLA